MVVVYGLVFAIVFNDLLFARYFGDFAFGAC